MKPCFADAFYYLALLNENDAAHESALAVSARSLRLVTTWWVLTEVADAMSAPHRRHLFLALLETILADQFTEIEPISRWTLDAGLALYRERPDKDWSLTDCISFAVMRERGLDDALTGDRHFAQAGFNPLLQ